MSKEQIFWNWFQKNEERLFEIERDLERKFAELRLELDKYYPALSFEFGPVIDGKRDFVISAEGIKDKFPFVTALGDAAPPLPRWNVIKFRPARRLITEFTYEGVSAGQDGIKFVLGPDGDKPGIIFYFDNFDETQRKQFIALTFLYLDNYLGEYNVTMHVGSIQAKPATEPITMPRQPLTELPLTFNRFIKASSN